MLSAMCVHVYMYTCMYVYVRMYADICVYACAYICTHVQIYACMHVCMGCHGCTEGFAPGNQEKLQRQMPGKQALDRSMK